MRVTRPSEPHYAMAIPAAAATITTITKFTTIFIIA